MADGTAIEWTDATWNIVTGCSVVSPGCTNCYAMKLAGSERAVAKHPSRVGLTADTKAGPVWTGEVRFNEPWLTQPLHWRKPRKIFVCAHGDLFHEKVPDEWLDRVFAVMALAPQHIFQVLTKRPERARAYLTGFEDRPDEFGKALAGVVRGAGKPKDMGLIAIDEFMWPLPNVWLGVSVEDQQRADERIPVLLDTPAAVRWLSMEPLLGPVDLGAIRYQGDRDYLLDALEGRYGTTAPRGGGNIFSHGLAGLGRLNWIVLGGESGPGARPMHPDWARQTRDQCAAAGVPFLFKQWGSWHENWSADRDGPTHFVTADGRQTEIVSGMMYPSGGIPIRKVAKHLAGRLLDGVEHNGYPE